MSDDLGKKEFRRWAVSANGRRSPKVLPGGEDKPKPVWVIDKITSYLSRAGIIIMAVSAVFLSLSYISPPNEDPVRRDALMVMKASMMPYTVAGYCNKEIAGDPALLEAVQQWNQQNGAHLERVVAAIKATGDMRTSQKDEITRNALKKAKRVVGAQKDKIAYCADHARAVRDGAFDIDKNPETRDAMQRLLSVDLTRRRTRDAAGQWKYVE